jgi:dienelactone hydrolase
MEPGRACRWLAAYARPDAQKVELVVYPGAHHAFDIVAFNPGRSLRGRWVEYDEAASKDAEEKTRAFLDAHLVKTSPSEPTAKVTTDPLTPKTVTNGGTGSGAET